MKVRYRIGLALLLILPALWTLGAAYFAFGRGPAGLAAVAALAAGHGAFLLHPRLRPRAWAWTAGTFAAGALWFLLLTPSDDRDWIVEVSRAPTATVEGDTAVVRDIRFFRYRSETDFDPAWVDRTYDLRLLRAADLYMCYWDGNTEIAHTMLSFDFGEQGHLCLSVEIRREKGEAWGGLPGIYRQFEIVYVLADELDLVNLRTGYRGEDLYLYRLRVPKEDVRRYLEHVLRRCNELVERPEFYDTLEYNCSSSLSRMSAEIWPDRPRGVLDRVLNGRADEEGWKRGILNNDVPFPELRRRSAVTERGRAVRDDPEFSRKIREGLPL